MTDPKLKQSILIAEVDRICRRENANTTDMLGAALAIGVIAAAKLGMSREEFVDMAQTGAKALRSVPWKVKARA